jgi:hypothetical protein
MEARMTVQPVKMTISIPPDIAKAMESERKRMASDLRTHLSFNQIAVRMLSLGLDTCSKS